VVQALQAGCVLQLVWPLSVSEPVQSVLTEFLCGREEILGIRVRVAVVDIVGDQLVENGCEIFVFAVVERVDGLGGGEFPFRFPQSLDAAQVRVCLCELFSQSPVRHLCFCMWKFKYEVKVR